MFTVDNTLNNHPNTTIILPGKCQAKCGFCFWNSSDGRIKPPSDYIEKLRFILLNLPDKYRSLSVSGGEPTLSPYLADVLDLIGEEDIRRKFSRTVLTTNGVRLYSGPWYKIDKAIDHINISRHHYDEELNAEIFNTPALPTAEDIRQFAKKADLTLNCVIPPDFADTEFIFKFISFAKSVNAVAVSFRTQASDIQKSPVELKFIELFSAGSSNNCPVCRGHTQDVLGFQVRWKGSVPEPSITCGKTYEAVIRPDGAVYADWAGNHELVVAKRPTAPRSHVPHVQPVKAVKQKPQSYPSDRCAAGCGSGGCG